MINVLFVGVSDKLGGIETFVINTYRKINKEIIQIDFIKYTKNICFEDEFIQNGSKIYYIPPRKKILKHYLYLFYFFYKNRNYHIVHYHINTASCISAIIFAKIFKIKVVVHSHNTLNPSLKTITGLLHYFNKLVLYYLPVTKLACSISAGNQTFKNKYFEFVINGIELSKFYFNKDKRKFIRDQLKLENNFVIGHIGNFKTEKNHEFLIDIFNLYNKENPSSKLILVGDGFLKSFIQKKVITLGLNDSVLFLGVRKDIQDLLNGFDLFILPSTAEGLPFVLVEAQASGLQCLVSNNVPKDVFITNQVHSLSLNDSLHHWTKKIYELSKYERIDNSSNLALKKFDISNTVFYLENLYNKLNR